MRNEQQFGQTDHGTSMGHCVGVRFLGKTQFVERLIVPRQFTDGQDVDMTDDRNSFSKQIFISIINFHTFCTHNLSLNILYLPTNHMTFISDNIVFNVIHQTSAIFNWLPVFKFFNYVL